MAHTLRYTSKYAPFGLISNPAALYWPVPALSQIKAWDVEHLAVAAGRWNDGPRKPVESAR
jgi:hypothetical protein